MQFENLSNLVSEKDVPKFKLSALLGSDVDAAILAGDPHQTIPEVRARQPVGNDELVSRWLGKCHTAQWHAFNESRRVANPLAKLMVEIFPDLGSYGTCRSAEERTLFLPIWFETFQDDEE